MRLGRSPALPGEMASTAQQPRSTTPAGSARPMGCAGLQLAPGRPERAPLHCGYSTPLSTEGDVKGFFRFIFNTAHPSFWKLDYYRDAKVWEDHAGSSATKTLHPRTPQPGLAGSYWGEPRTELGRLPGTGSPSPQGLGSQDHPTTPRPASPWRLGAGGTSSAFPAPGRHSSASPDPRRALRCPGPAPGHPGPPGPARDRGPNPG